jgi:hypothetical protein
LDRDRLAHRARHARPLWLPISKWATVRRPGAVTKSVAEIIRAGAGLNLKTGRLTAGRRSVIFLELPTGFGSRTRRPAPRAGTARAVSLMATTTRRQVAEEPQKTGRFGTLAPAMAPAEAQRLFIRF